MLSDSRLFRETIAARLKFESGIHLVATAGSIHKLWRRLDGRVADMALVHTRIDGVLGRELLWDAKTLLPATHLIVLGFRRSRQDLLRWVEAGATAYLEQEASSGELLATIHGVARGMHPKCSMALLTHVVEYRRRMTHLSGRSCTESLCDRDLETAIRRPSGDPNGQVPASSCPIDR